MTPAQIRQDRRAAAARPPNRWADGNGTRWWWMVAAAYLVAFLGVDWVTESVSGPLEVSLWFPPAGLTVVLVLVAGGRALPLAAVAHGAHIALFRSDQLWLIVLGGVVIAAVYTGATLLFLRRVGTRRLRRLAEVARFVGILCVAAPLVVGVLSTVGYAIVGLVPWDELVQNSVGGWAGDGTGIAVAVPFAALVLRLVEARREGELSLRDVAGVPALNASARHGTLELAGQALLLGGTVFVAYGAPRGVNVDFAYLTFVPLTWIAVRDGFGHTIVALLVFNVGAVALAGGDSGQTDPVLLQFGLMIATLLTLLLGASTTDYRASRALLARSEGRFRSVVENAAEAIEIVDADGTLRFASPAFRRLFGHDPDTMIGADMLDWVHPDDRAEVRAATRRALAAGDGAISSHAYRFRRADGSYVPVESVSTHLLADPDVEGLVMHVRDVSERRAFEARLEHLAYHDALTGLPNRALLGDRLEQALARARRTRDEVGVLFLDLDDFKDVNDSLGHEAGDALLRQCAERLGEGLRPGDTLARLGGDEFCVLVEGAGVDATALLAERLLNRIGATPFALPTTDGQSLRASASIGLAVAVAGTPGPGELLKRADLAMYRAKRDGGGRIAHFEDELAAGASARLALRQELVRALEGDELEVHFQPNVALTTGEVRWMEALVRWRHPVRGLLPPAVFVGLAEDTGLIAELGRQVLRIALAEQRRWAAAGTPVVPRVAVNVSGRQLQDEGIVEEVLAALRAAGTDPSVLSLEITESVFTQDERSLGALRRLREAGIRLCIDDFGTGHSSLAALRSLPARALKIDASFVRDLATGGDGAVMLAAIVTLAKAADMEVIAEGIQTAEQLRLVECSGCDLGQGYHLCAPLPAAETLRFLAAHTPGGLLAGRNGTR